MLVVPLTSNSCPMPEKKISILYVDDEENNLMSFKATFRLKYDVSIANSGDEAYNMLQRKPVDIIITDQRMPNMTGIEFLEKILGEFPDPMRILLTGYADLNAVIEAVNKGKIYHYLAKPWIEDEIHITIRRAYETYIDKQKIRNLNEMLTISNDQLEFLLRQKLVS